MHAAPLNSQRTRTYLAGRSARFLLARRPVLERLFREKHPGSRRHNEEHKDNESQLPRLIKLHLSIKERRSEEFFPKHCNGQMEH